MRKEREIFGEPILVLSRLGLAFVAFFGLAGFWMKNPEQFISGLSQSEMTLMAYSGGIPSNLKILRQSSGFKNNSAFTAIDLQFTGRDFKIAHIRNLLDELQNQGIHDCRLRIFSNGMLNKADYYIQGNLGRNAQKHIAANSFEMGDWVFHYKKL